MDSNCPFDSDPTQEISLADLPDGDFDEGKPSSITVADVDGDGFLDLVTTRRRTASSTGDIVILYNRDTNDAERFDKNEAQLVRRYDGLSPIMELPYEVKASDFDLDGDLDLIVGCGHRPKDEDDTIETSSKNVLIFRRIAPRKFDLVPEVRDVDECVALVVDDLDGDGEPDIIAAANLGDELVVYYGGR